VTLSLADAIRLITGAVKKANQIGTKIIIAMCDAGGRLLALMNGAMWAGSFGSQSKDMASAAFGKETPHCRFVGG
jgi:glc operon protein GlcG